MTVKLGYRSTIFAGFIGYITQSITLNFSSLLYVTFGRQYGLSYSEISSLIVICFLAQLLTDAVAAKFPHFFKPRPTVILAQLVAALGVAGFGFLPRLLPPYAALAVAVVLSGFGSGLVEVMVSPVVEACPTKRKSAIMCLLHSFYCWGHVLVVLLSMFYFSIFGVERWEYLAYFWALVPLVDMLLFCFVPLFETESEESKKQPHAFMKKGTFWLIFIVMLGGGASELAMSQWASAFAETGLGMSKTLGDLLGPCLFALFMGASRLIYAKTSHRISLRRFMIVSCVLCVFAYLLAALAPTPALAFVGCALCGLSVGIMWPGSLSYAKARIPRGGVSMFALLALGGDIGCLLGPPVVGVIAEAFGNDLSISFLFSAVFPAIMLVALFFLSQKQKPSQTH